jgi:hypothetical protein
MAWYRVDDEVICYATSMPGDAPSISACTNSVSRDFVAQMLAQQDTKPAQRPHAHHFEGMP